MFGRDRAEALGGHAEGGAQYRGDPRPPSDRVRDECVPISAPSCRSSPGGSPDRPAGVTRPDDRRVAGSSGTKGGGHSRQSSWTPSGPRSSGRRRRARIASRLYTRPYARAFDTGPAQARQTFAPYADVEKLARTSGLGVNAGHDLDLDNLVSSGSCRSSTRSRSATRSFRAPSFAGLSVVVRGSIWTLTDGILSADLGQGRVARNSTIPRRERQRRDGLVEVITAAWR